MSIVLCKNCYTTHYEHTQHTTFNTAPAYVFYRICTICQRMHDAKQFEIEINGDIPPHICYGLDTDPARMRLDYVGWDNSRGVKGFICRGCGKGYWCDIDKIPREPGALREVEPEEERLFAEMFGQHRRNGGIETLDVIELKRKGGENAMIRVRYNEQTGQMETYEDGLGEGVGVDVTACIGAAVNPVNAPVSAAPAYVGTFAPSHTFTTVPPGVPIQEVMAAPTSVAPVPAPEPAQEQPLPIKEDIAPEMLHAARQVLQQAIMLTAGIDAAITARQQMRDTIAIMTCPYSVRDLLTRGDGPQDTVVVVSVAGGETDLEHYQVHGRVYSSKTKRLGKKVFQVYTQKYQWQSLPEKYEGKMEKVIKVYTQKHQWKVYLEGEEIPE